MNREFTKEELQSLLLALNDELKLANATGEICIVGGAAMILAFGNRDSTRDIDALLIRPAVIREAAAKVARDRGFPQDWLNDGAKGFASAVSFEAHEILSCSNLRVVSPPADYILAMKCIAARSGLDDHDRADAAFLITHLGLKSVEETLAVVSRFYDASRIPAKTHYFVHEICHEIFPKT